MENFWNKVEMIPEHGCWEWVGGKSPDGYGKIKTEGKTKRAHRVSFEMHKGPIPDGMLVCHTCDNITCVNPNHLFLGTHKDNVTDMCNKGRKARQDGEYNNCSKLTRQQVNEIRKLYKPIIFSQSKLAKLFNTHQSVISQIVNNKSWK